MKVYSGEEIWHSIEFYNMNKWRLDLLEADLLAELYVKKSDVEALLKSCNAEQLLNGISEDEH